MKSFPKIIFVKLETIPETNEIITVMKIHTHRFIKYTAIVISVLYLQSCTTLRVIELAKGIDKGAISPTAKIDGAWFDTEHQNFIVCMEDIPQFPNKQGNRYQLTVPKNLTALPDAPLEYKPHTISVLIPEAERHWWSSAYRDRTDIRLYNLTVEPNYNCNGRITSWVEVLVLNSPKDISDEDANRFHGQKIKQMLSQRLPFISYVINRTNKTSPDEVCQNLSDEGCLLLVTNFDRKDQNLPQISFTEVFNVKQLIWKSEPAPTWYLALPFAVASDVALIAIFLFFIGAAGGGGGAGG